MGTEPNSPRNQARTVTRRLKAAMRRIPEQADFQVGRIILLLRTGAWVPAPPGHGETKGVIIPRLNRSDVEEQRIQ